MSESNEQPQASGKTARRGFHWRGFFSLLLFASFTLLAVSGIVLYFSPKGRVANWTGWTVLKLYKEEWSSVHIVLALPRFDCGGLPHLLQLAHFLGLH